MQNVNVEEQLYLKYYTVVENKTFFTEKGILYPVQVSLLSWASRFFSALSTASTLPEQNIR